MTTHICIDETKHGSFVLAAVALPDPPAVRRVVDGLVRSGNPRLHMVDEGPRQRPRIVASLVQTGIEARIYDAGRSYRTDAQARRACFEALVADLAPGAGGVRLIIERDDSLVASDQRLLYLLVRAAGIADLVEYRHLRGHEDCLLALPDVVAWCWARSPEWRRRIEPILSTVRHVRP